MLQRTLYGKYGLILLNLLAYLASDVQAADSQFSCDATMVNTGKAGYEYVLFNNPLSPERLKKRHESGITYAAIEQAKKLQHDFGVFPKPTPLYSNDRINQFAKKLLGHNIVIYMKDETQNPTGSFKDRMPIHFYQKIDDDIQHTRNGNNKFTKEEMRVLAVSTGNHGRAAAYAANTANHYIKQQGLQSQFHLYSEIVMPYNALSHKKTAIANLGATIRDHYASSSPDKKPIPNYEAAENLVISEAKSDSEHTMLLLHADKYAINGYGVIADEMIQQAFNNGIDLAKVNAGEAMMLVPLGSGGLLSGTEEISVRYPNVYSVGVTAAPADLTYRSLKFCKMIRTAEPFEGQLIVDGVMATPEEFSLNRINEVAKEVVLVQQQDAVYATALLKKHGIIIEPTSGLPLAGLLLGASEEYNKIRYAFVVLTGRNISHDMEKTISKLAAQDEQVLFDYFKQRRSDIKHAIHKENKIT